MKSNLITHNIVKKKPGNTTITIKVTENFKHKWDKWAFDNNINKSKTLQAVLTNLMKNYNETNWNRRYSLL